MAVQSGKIGNAMKDGRQSEIASDIQRGVGRCLTCLDVAHVTELGLASGRRADVVGLTRKGEIWIIEIKSSLSDFRSDSKWPGYLDYCDRFYFAIMDRALLDVLPVGEGVILADRFGAEIVREAQSSPLPAQRRKAMIIRFGHAAARQLHRLIDPEFGQV